MGKSVWFFNAHPDDINAGLGLALVLKEMKEYDLHIGAYTRGEGGLQRQGVSFEECAAIRTAEEKEVCAGLGVEPVFLPEKDDGTCAAGLDTCNVIAQLLRETQPVAIITHWPVDTHPDHVMCAAAVSKAIRMSQLPVELYYYRQNRQCRNFPEDFYFPFDENIMSKKCELLSLYVCQSGSSIAQRERIEDTYNGFRCGAPFAECFASFQLPGEGSFFAEVAENRKKYGI